MEVLWCHWRCALDACYKSGKRQEVVASKKSVWYRYHFDIFYHPWRPMRSCFCRLYFGLAVIEKLLIKKGLWDQDTWKALFDWVVSFTRTIYDTHNTGPVSWSHLSRAIFLSSLIVYENHDTSYKESNKTNHNQTVWLYFHEHKSDIKSKIRIFLIHSRWS